MFKNFFLNRVFTPTPYNLIWDSLLVWIAGSAIFFLPNQIQKNGFFTSVVAYLITVVLFGGWFGWRRAWIQRAIQNHYKNDQLEEFNERQRASEQRQTQTMTQRTGSHPKLGLIDQPLSQQQPRAERGTNARLGLIDEPLPRKPVHKTEQQPFPLQVPAPQPDPDDQLEHYYYSYSIAIPRSIKWSSSQATAFIRSLLSRANGWVQLSIVGQPGKVFWEVTHFVGEHEQPLTEAVIAEVAAAHYPGSQVKRLVRDHRTEMKRRYKIMGADFNFWFDEGLTADDIKNRDPLLEVVRVMSQLKPGEELRYRISIIAVNPPDQQNIESIIFVSAREMYEPVNGPVSPTNWSSLAGSLAGVAIGRIFQEIQLRSQKVLRFSEKDTQRYLQKLSQPLVTCFVSVEMDSPDASRLMTLEHMVGAVEQLTSGSKLRLSSLKAYTSPVIPIENKGDFIFKTPLDYLMDLAPEKEGDLDGTLPYLFSLTIDELGALWHLPSHLFEAGGGDILRPTLLPPELLDPDPSKSVIVGQAEGHAIGIQMRDLNLHAFVAGMQGQGKSTLLTNLAQQLIAAGHGVAIIDPHRKLINDIIASSIDEEAAKRTVLLEAEDSEYPIPLNPMRATPGMSRDGLFSSLMWIIKALYAKSWSEGQMERMFRNILQVVITDPEATPLDIQKLIDDPNYRRRALVATKASLGRVPRTLNDFWKTFDESSESAQRERTGPVLNRLGVFLDGPAELMMSHPFGLDFRNIITGKKIMLFDLGGESMMSEADNLGSIFFAMLFFHAYALGPIEEGAPPRYHVIIDETHRFVKAPIQQMFSEARKYGLSLIMADQWLGQLEDNTREGIINNKGTTISFKVAPDQAKDTARLLEPYVTADDLIKQGRGRTAMATVYHAQTMPAFQLDTLPPPSARYDVATKRAAAKANVPSVMFSPDPQLKPRVMSANEIDQWLDQRYSAGIFGRDLQADSNYEDTATLDEGEPRSAEATETIEDLYSDTDEV